MGRLPLAGALVAAWVGIASAGPTRKVLIETEPPGATVYLDDVDRGPACKETPCTIEAPIGTSTLILRLDKHEPEITELDVPKGKGKYQQKYKLRGAMATIVVDGPKGAKVRVDQEDSGTAPVRVQVSSGEGHHVSVALGSKTLYDDFVEVATGDEFVVKAKTAGTPATTVAETANVANDDDDDDDDDDNGGGGGGSASSGSSGGSVTGGTESVPRRAYLTAGVAMDVGFRTFTYRSPMMNSGLRDLDQEDGEFIAGPAIELWPGRMAGVNLLRGLSLFARVQFPVVGPSFDSDTGGLMGKVTTKWGSFEVSVRHRWTFGAIGVEVGSGFVQDRFTYDATVGSDINMMPNTRYRSIRLGGKLVYVTERVEPYVAVENRIVQSGGPVEERFDSASINGMRGSVGVAIKIAPLTIRAEGTLQSYSWTFTSTTGTDPPATGAADTIKLISGLVGYSY